MDRRMVASRFSTFLKGGLVVLFISGGLLGYTQERTWISADGKKLEASLLSADGEMVSLRLKGGREVKVPRKRLSNADQQFLDNLAKQGLTLAVGKMPEETQTPRTIKVEGGPHIFRTAHFEFETDQKVSKAFIAEAARVYEGTYLALEKMPLGLKLAPPEGMTHYRGLFMNRHSFKTELSDSIPNIPGQEVVGVYMLQRKELLVPYSSLGAKKMGSQMTLRRTSDTSTLIHEIIHQLMHDRLAFIPPWFAEGLSEYISAVPYQNGRFEFKNAKRGLVERLETGYRIKRSDALSMIPPSRMISGRSKPKVETSAISGVGERIGKVPGLGGFVKPNNPTLPVIEGPRWRGTVLEYRDAMLLMYFFVHLDRKEAPAAPVAAYLKLVDNARTEADKFMAEYNQFIADYNEEVDSFEARRKAYNQAIRQYREDFKTYQMEAKAYNSYLTLLNNQIREGIPKKERIQLETRPKEPAPPKELVVPKILQETPSNNPADIIQAVRKRADQALFRGRTAEELDAAVVKAYAEIGIKIHLLN